MTTLLAKTPKKKIDNSKFKNRRICGLILLAIGFILVVASLVSTFIVKGNEYVVAYNEVQNLRENDPFGPDNAAKLASGLKTDANAETPRTVTQIVLPNMEQLLAPNYGANIPSEEQQALDIEISAAVAALQTKENLVPSTFLLQLYGQSSMLMVIGIIMLAFGAALFFSKKQDIVFPIINGVILCFLMFITLYPVLNTVAISFNDGTDALRGDIGLWPRMWSFKAYNTLLTDPLIYQAFFISVSRTVITTILNLLLTSMLAFALSRKEYVLRKFITTAMVLTMYVNAGLIPNYLLISNTLNLDKSFWVYIIPTMFSCFNMIVIRTYISGLPEALSESARIDGAGDFRIFWRIILPLCTPVLATVALFVAVGSWNQWFDTQLYNGSKKDLYTLQYLLKMKLATSMQSANKANATADALAQSTNSTPITVRCAITVVSALPILVVYPFLQRYFVTGMVLGGVKG